MGSERVRVIEVGEDEPRVKLFVDAAQAAVEAAERPSHRFYDTNGQPLSLRDGEDGPELGPQAVGLAQEELLESIRAGLDYAREVGTSESELRDAVYDSPEELASQLDWLRAAPTLQDMLTALEPTLLPEHETSRRRLCRLFRTC
jgi:hypothetical protein